MPCPGIVAVVARGEGDVAAEGGGAGPRVIEDDGTGGPQAAGGAEVVAAAGEGVAAAVKVVGAEVDDAGNGEIAEHAVGTGAVAEAAGEFQHPEVHGHPAAEVVGRVGQNPATGTIEVVVAGIRVDGEGQHAGALADQAVDGVTERILAVQHEGLVAFAVGKDVTVQDQRTTAAAGNAHGRGTATQVKGAVGAVALTGVFEAHLLGAARQAEVQGRTGAQCARQAGILEVPDAHAGDLRGRANGHVADVVAHPEHAVPGGAADGVVVHVAVAGDGAKVAAGAVVIHPQHHAVAKRDLASGLAQDGANRLAAVELQGGAAQDVEVVVVVHGIVMLTVDDQAPHLKVGVGRAGQGLDGGVVLIARRLQGHRAGGIEDQRIVAGKHAPEVVVARALKNDKAVVDDVEPVRLAVVENAGDDHAAAALALQDGALGAGANAAVNAGVDGAGERDGAESLAQQRDVAGIGVVVVGIEINGVRNDLMTGGVKAQVAVVQGGGLQGDRTGAQRTRVGVRANAQFRRRVGQTGRPTKGPEVAADHGGATVGVVACQKDRAANLLITARAADRVGDDCLAAEAGIIGGGDAVVDDDLAMVDDGAAAERARGRRGRLAADQHLRADANRQAVDLVGGVGEYQATRAADGEAAGSHRPDAPLQGQGRRGTA